MSRILLLVTFLYSTYAKEDVYFAGFWNLLSADALGNLPAVKLAVEHVNNNTAILNDYRLILLHNVSTEVSISTSRCIFCIKVHINPNLKLP